MFSLVSTRKLDDPVPKRSPGTRKLDELIWLVSTRKLDDLARPMALAHEKTRGRKSTYSTPVEYVAFSPRVFSCVMAIGRKNSRSKINLFDACRISCFFATRNLVLNPKPQAALHLVEKTEAKFRWKPIKPNRFQNYCHQGSKIGLNLSNN